MSAQGIVVTGAGHLVLEPDSDASVAADPMPYLRARKMRKYMGLQDDLAVIATARALAAAGLGPADLGERAGLYWVVGHVPYERSGIDELLEGAVVDGQFSMAAFTTRSYAAVSPLRTFRCLPNMPAFHVSLNFDVQGPYFVSFPGPGQVYAALEEARLALERGAVDVALLGAVAHQRNFLVRQHFGRLDGPPQESRLRDAAGVVVLEQAAHAQARSAPIRAWLEEDRVTYHPHNPLEEGLLPSETVSSPGATHAAEPETELGAASLPVALSRHLNRGAGGAGVLEHRLRSRDGIEAISRWRLLA